MEWEVGGRSKREGTYVYLWLIHAEVWQKTTEFCKAIILQLKITIFFLKEEKLEKKKANIVIILAHSCPKLPAI